MDFCNVIGCPKPIFTKRSGLCQMHYLRQYRHGNVDVVLIRADGTGSVTALGYTVFSRKYEHVILVEQALGHTLPRGAEVHHVNGDRSDNHTPGNLVVCQDHSYHKFLEYRGRALRESGHADWLKCQYCKQWDSPENITTTLYGGKSRRFHQQCRHKYNLNYERKSHGRTIRRTV